MYDSDGDGPDNDSDGYDPDAAVYWRRRGVAIAGVVAVVLFMLWAFSGPSQPESANQAVPEFNAAGARPLGFQQPAPVAGEPVAPPPGYPLPSPSAQAGLPAAGAPQAGLPARSPRIAAPSSVQSESVQPRSARPGSAQPESAQPESAQPDSVQPGSAQPGSVQPESAQPGSAQRGSVQPGSAQPGSPSVLPDTPGSTAGAPGSAPGAPGSGTAPGTRVVPGSPAANPELTLDQGRQPVKTRPEPTTVGPCSNRVISILARVGAKSYRSGTKPGFQLVVTNMGDVPCTRDLDAGLQEMIVSGPDETRLWSSNDCFPVKKADVRTLQPGKPQVFALEWAGRTSKPGCGGQRTALGPGNYRLIAKLGALSSGPTPFTITK